MMPASTLLPLATASDADVREFLSSDKLQQFLPTLDDFFSCATTLQTQESNKTHEASVHALQTETRAVFSLFLRLLDAPGLLALGLNCGVLHVTRLVPFCQVYAPKNTQAVQELLDAVLTEIPFFSTTVSVLRQLYTQQLGDLHTSVQQAKRGQVVELIHRCYEISLSVSGMVSSLSVADLLLLDGKDLEEELILQSQSLVYGLVQCYEADLPNLQRQLSTLDEVVELKEKPIIAETRHALLVALGRCLDVVMEKQIKSESTGEELLAGLHALSNGSQDDEAEHGSYLSDLWCLSEYKDKIAAFFEHCKLDQENFSYLDMVVEQLPRRRILPAMLIDDLAAENKPKATLSANAKEWTASESSAAIAAADGETKAPAPQTNESATSFEPMVNQVKDFFPDLGEGFVELCLLSSGLQVEVVINFLLESNPPPVLIDVPQDLKRSDPDFERLEAQITGKPAPAAKVSREEPKKLDPSRVWENRRMRAKEEKDAFWEGMKNRNRENHANGADAEDAGDEEKAETKSGDQKFSRT
ncbi:hypothetical protein BBO99_00009338, partial [Phytophthora kernoviae]